jgi:hypothetical protein
LAFIKLDRAITRQMLKEAGLPAGKGHMAPLVFMGSED